MAKLKAVLEKLRPTEPNYIRVQLDVVLDVPGKGAEALEDAALTVALTNGLRDMGVDVRNAMRAKRKLIACDLQGRRR